jgi:hypothetical protein
MARRVYIYRIFEVASFSTLFTMVELGLRGEADIIITRISICTLPKKGMKQAAPLENLLEAGRSKSGV